MDRERRGGSAPSKWHAGPGRSGRQRRPESAVIVGAVPAKVLHGHQKGAAAEEPLLDAAHSHNRRMRSLYLKKVDVLKKCAEHMGAVPVTLDGEQSLQGHRHQAQRPVSGAFLGRGNHCGQAGQERLTSHLGFGQRRVKTRGEDIGSAALERALGRDAGIERAQQSSSAKRLLTVVCATVIPSKRTFGVIRFDLVIAVSL